MPAWPWTARRVRTHFSRRGRSALACSSLLFLATRTRTMTSETNESPRDLWDVRTSWWHAGGATIAVHTFDEDPLPG
jgi:hypothetical protein